MLIWLVLACLLPGVVGATALLFYQYRQSRAQLEEDTIQTARALVQAVDSHLLKAQAVAGALASSDALAMHDFDRFHEWARDAVVLAGLGANVILMDETGQQVLNTDLAMGAPLPNEVVADQVRKVFATGQPAISNVYTSSLSMRSVMRVIVPVVIDGKVTYALSVGILPEHFSAILNAQSLPPGWVATVIDSTGTIVGRTHASDQFVGNQAHARLLRVIRASPEGSIAETARDGDPIVSFYSNSAITDWSVAIDIPRHELQGLLVPPLFLLTAGVAGLFGVGLILAWFMGGRIAYSVKALAGAAMALGSEEEVLVPRVHIKEAAEVARAIERAAAMLKERDAKLRAREAELEEAHRLARFGTWHWDLVKDAVHTSAGVREVLGGEAPTTFATYRGNQLTVESWERVNTAVQEARRTGQGYDLELQFNHASGRVGWIDAKGEAVKNDRNEVIALRGTVQDVTERKAQEEALRASERNALAAAHRAEAERRQLDAVLEATPVGIVVANVDGGQLRANRANRQLWGNYPAFDSVDCYGKFMGVWADGSDRHGQRLAPQDWAMARAIRGYESAGDIIEIETFDDPPVRRIVVISGAPIRDREGTIVGGVVAEMDITDRVRAEEELRQADRRKDEFLAMLAHELRNPLAPIAAAANLLGTGRLDETRTRQVSAIVARQVRHLTALVDELLDVSRVTRGLITLERRMLDARCIVADAIEQVRPVLEARRHKLQVRLPTEPILIFGDQKRLVQVMSNLLNNAAKFTSAGGVIELNMEQAGDDVVITVADNGLGMAPDLLDHVFDLFVQEERTSDRSEGGLGIGLALVKCLVELHQGDVTAYSEGIGKGSKFTARLPLHNGISRKGSAA